MPTRAVNWTELRALANRPDTLVIVGMLLRPGVRVFGAALEWEHFPPGTPANDRLQVAYVEWDEFAWAVYFLPAGERPHCNVIAKRYGLRIADGVPTIIHHGQANFFPLRGSNVWTLEHRDRGMADGTRWAALREREDRQVLEIEAKAKREREVSRG